MEIDSRHHAQVWSLFLLFLFQRREDQEGEKMLTITPQKQSPVPQSLLTVSVGEFYLPTDSWGRLSYWE